MFIPKIWIEAVRTMRVSLAGGEPFEEEMRFLRTDGEYRWFLIRAVPLRDKRGKIVKWYGVATDIEDRKRAEQLQADLTHTSRVSTMGELVASISHELAQPITVTTAHAKASLRWLQRDPPDLTEVRKGTERIIEAGTLASEIINRLRSLYKKAPPKRELVAINEVIGEMVGMLGGEANEHAVSIRTDLDRRSSHDHGRSGATSAGTDEPDAEWHRGDEGDGRRAYGEVAIGRGRPDRDLCK